MTTNLGPEPPSESPRGHLQNQKEKDGAREPIAWSIRRVAADPRKGARLIARTFYRELRRLGWTDQDIMTVADELLGCMLASLHEYRLKTETPAAEMAGRIQ